MEATKQAAADLERYALEVASERSATREGAMALIDANYMRARSTESGSSEILPHPQRSFARPNALQDYAKNRFPRDILKLWREAVLNHVEKQPFTDDERDAISEEYGEDEWKHLLETPLLVYGTTLIFVGIADTFIVYAQIGDGDILVVGDDGAVEHPIARDPALFANETTSLCTEDAERHIQVVVQHLVEKPPALILAMTDGYSNSYRDEASFYRVGTDFLERLCRENGIAEVRSKLEMWLQTISEQGSGDDISLALAYRVAPAVRAISPTPL